MGWQRPDFRKEDEYPNHVKGGYWAWEFLRRNSDYADECARFRDYDSGTAPDELKQAYVTACRKFSVNMLRDPEMVGGNYLRKVDLLFRISSSPAKLLIKGVHCWPENDYQAVFQFDLRYPLQEQLDFAKSELEVVRQIVEMPMPRLGKPASKLDNYKKNQRPHKGKFVTYLRLLDWKHECPDQSISEIVPLMASGEKNEDRGLERRLEANLKAANELMNGGYIKLAEFEAIKYSENGKRESSQRLVNTKKKPRKKIIR